MYKPQRNIINNRNRDYNYLPAKYFSQRSDSVMDAARLIIYRLHHLLCASVDLLKKEMVEAKICENSVKCEVFDKAILMLYDDYVIDVFTSHMHDTKLKEIKAGTKKIRLRKYKHYGATDVHSDSIYGRRDKSANEI